MNIVVVINVITIDKLVLLQFHVELQLLQNERNTQ